MEWKSLFPYLQGSKSNGRHVNTTEWKKIKGYQISNGFSFKLFLQAMEPIIRNINNVPDPEKSLIFRNKVTIPTKSVGGIFKHKWRR